MKNIALYLTTVLIWGSTWLGIRYQLGNVAPLASVTYRFLLSGAILLVYCRIVGLNLSFSLHEHLYIALQALLLFAVNYWLVYLAEVHLTSGLVAIVFTTMIFFNIVFGAVFLHTRVRWTVAAGGAVGIFGVMAIFFDELRSFDVSNRSTVALIWVFVSVVLASLGNIASARNQKAGLPVVQTNAFGMLYGGLAMLILTLATGTPLDFDFSFAYLASLFYLAVFGSIIAFGCYLTLVGAMGADKAAYTSFLTPLIALFLSTVFEEYTWSKKALLGVSLVLAGNLIALWGKRSR